MTARRPVLATDPTEVAPMPYPPRIPLHRRRILLTDAALIAGLLCGLTAALTLWLDAPVSASAARSAIDAASARAALGECEALHADCLATLGELGGEATP